MKTVSGPSIDRLGTTRVNNSLEPVQIVWLSTGQGSRDPHPVYVCGHVRARKTTTRTDRSRIHPQSTALITRTIFHHHLVMSTMGENHHAVHV